MDINYKLRTLICTIIIITSYSKLYSQPFLYRHIDSINAVWGYRAFDLADLDNDGFKDIVICDRNTNNLYNLVWYKNNNNIEFNSPIIISSGLSQYNLIKSVDLDNDGNNDILLASDETICWYKNIGSSIFETNKNIIINNITQTSFLDICDFDQDGDMDIMYMSTYDYNIHFILNDGNGNFSNDFIYFNGNNKSINTYSLMDYDYDSDMDILLSYYSYSGSNKLVWLENIDLDNSFIEHTIIPNTEVSINQISVNDIDLDGDFDIICTGYNNWGESKLFWYQNNNNNFNNYYLIDDVDLLSPNIIYTFDIDVDGDFDIFYGGKNNSEFIFYENNGNNSFNKTIIASNIYGIYDYSISLNSNGFYDLVVLSGMHLFSLKNLQNLPIITFKTYIDYNLNNVYDSQDREYPQAKIVFDTYNLTVYTNNQGSATIALDAGIYTISAQIDSNWIQTTQPNTYNVTITDSSSVDTLLFGFKPKNLINDISIHINPLANTRCATTVPFQITYTNTGTTILNGYITVAEENHITFVDTIANTPTDSISGNERFWFFDDLYPGESKSIIQYYTIADQNITGDTLSLIATACIPILYNNANDHPIANRSSSVEKVTICHCTASESNNYVVLEVPVSAIDGQGNNDHSMHDCDIIPITDRDGDGDIDADDCILEKPNYDKACFSSVHKNVIFCSYDPNDKQANPKGEGENNLTYKDEDIIYTIRFQNTGNDTAFHVQITDSLDKNLDINTFKFIAASHNNIQIQKQTFNVGTANEYHELSFTFHPIILPDSATNEVASQGFVSFSIKPKKDLPENTVINNTANIVFDKFTNYPVITNTVTNTLVSSLRVTTAILEKKYDVGINAYPNPFNSTVNIELSKPSTQQSVDISIVNIEGKRLKVLTNITNDNINIDLSSIATGAYFIAVEDTQTKELIGIEKIVKQ